MWFGNGDLRRGNWGQGTWDREPGAGNWRRELGAANCGQGTWDRELGTGNWGQGTGGQGTGGSKLFFCTGRGAMCAERHKSPSRIRMGSVRNEPDKHEQRNQTKTQNHPKHKQKPTNTENQIRLMSVLIKKSKRCRSEDQHRSETGR